VREGVLKMLKKEYRIQNIEDGSSCLVLSAEDKKTTRKIEAVSKIIFHPRLIPQKARDAMPTAGKQKTRNPWK
jgi:hypothetical protein